MGLKNFHVEINCPKCGELVTEEPSEIPSADYLSEGPGDGLGVVEEHITCGDCEHEFRITITAAWGGDYEVYLTENPRKWGNVCWDEVEDEDEDWFEGSWNDAEPDAYKIFNHALTEWHTLLDELPSFRSEGPGHRMLFVQLFAMLEAYLYDAIIALVENEPKHALAIIKSKCSVGDTSVTFRKALDDDYPQTFVVKWLKRFSFHRLDQVDLIMQACTGHPLLPHDKDNQEIIGKAIKLRHDCVHRNGKSLDGAIAVFDKTYLKRIAKAFESMVEKADANIIGF